MNLDQMVSVAEIELSEVVAPWMGSKVDVMSGRGYLFLTVI